MTTRTYQVKIGGHLFTDQVQPNQIDGLQITWGSVDGYDQPQATVATVSFLNPQFSGGTVVPSDLVGKLINFTITEYNDSLAGGVWFLNNFTIQQVSLEAVDSAADSNVMTITAVGPLASLSRYLTNRSDHPAQTVNARFADLQTDLYTQWGDVSGAVLWQDISIVMTWNYVDDYFKVPSIGSIDTRNLIASTASPTDALTFLQNMANNDGAWLFDYLSTSGEVPQVNWYPQNFFTTYTPVTVDASVVSPFQNLGNSVGMDILFNTVTVTNGTLQGYASDASSVINFGEYPLDITTDLADQAELDNLAKAKFMAHQMSNLKLGRLTLDIDQMSLSDFGDYTLPFNLIINNLPSVYLPAGPSGNYFQCRGWSLDVSTNHAEIDCVLVPKSVYDQGSTYWYGVDASYTWNTYLTALTTWADVA